MKKETFVKLVNAWKKEQVRLKALKKEGEIGCWLFVEDVMQILEDECQFYWWITQKPKTAHFDGVDYPVETPEEFWEYTQIEKEGLKNKVKK